MSTTEAEGSRFFIDRKSEVEVIGGRSIPSKSGRQLFYASDVKVYALTEDSMFSCKRKYSFSN